MLSLCMQRLFWDRLPISHSEFASSPLQSTPSGALNTLVIHGFTVSGSAILRHVCASLRSSLLTRNTELYHLLNHLLTNLTEADDMENGVLRGNRPAASNLWAVIGLPQFSGGQFPNKGDPRRSKVAGKAAGTHMRSSHAVRRQLH